MSKLREFGRYMAYRLHPLLDAVVDVVRAIGSTLRLLVIAVAVVLLFPLLIVLNFVCVYGRALWLQRYGLRARFDDEGVVLYTRHRGELRRVANAEIDHFDTEFDPPMSIWVLVLRNGETLRLPLAGREPVHTHCARHGLVCRGMLARVRGQPVDV